MKTVGECLEYMLRKKIIEQLTAFASTNKPPGFFEKVLCTVSEILSSITSTSILS